MSKPVVMEGWKWLHNATKWHYFREGKSLCGRWMVLNMNGCEQGNEESADNCKACRAKLAAEKTR